MKLLAILASLLLLSACAPGARGLMRDTGLKRLPRCRARQVQPALPSPTPMVCVDRRW